MTIVEPTIAELVAEQERLRLTKFNYDVAWEIGSRIRQVAASKAMPVAIEVRHGTDVVFASLISGSTIDNFDWTRRKCAVAHRFHKSSLLIRLESERDGYDLNARFRIPAEDYVASGGGFPIILKGGTLIDTIGVSGVPDVEDHRLITTVLSEMYN
ncbi:hypothetical protein G6L28_04710 [Agrobacterium larrymoorei]|uniref:heme-degrading domain-containing protein n=1 Tax=Agrobacterium larrymoorei TaxID=160699 RepID=UPI0015734B88|nr:heme-binding protein [Agrobacterium larrymoorei]NTJ41902.1 hypothetical protein [Agrobacterium larrymoorei]